MIEAFQIFNTRTVVGNNYDLKVTVEAEKCLQHHVALRNYYSLQRTIIMIADQKAIGVMGYQIPHPIGMSFLEPPYGVPYLTSDFVKFHDVMFPFKESTIVYRWNDDFSNYFDDGKEWWGTGLWSAYDKITNIFVIIGASQTD